MYTVELFDPVLNQTFDITSRTRNVQISKVLDTGVTSFTVNCRNIFLVHIFNRITIKKNSVTIISGVVVDQNEKDAGGDKDVVFACQNIGYFLPKRIVAEAFANKTASYMLNALIAKYLPEVTAINIDASTEVITEARFIYMTLKDVFEYIMNLQGPYWHYYIDDTDDYHFFYDFEQIGTTITADKIQLNTLGLDYEGIDHYNRVWVVGRKQPSTTAIDIYHTANGEQKYFGPLPYEPAALKIYYTPNGLPEYQLDISTEGNTTDDTEVIYNTKQKAYYLVNTESYTGKLRVNFKPMKQFIEYFENVADRDNFGLMEKAIKNKDVNNQLETRKYGKAAVQESSIILKRVTFNSYHPDMLTAQIGQKCPVNIVAGAWNITGDYLITRIVRSIPTDKNEYVSVEMEEL